MTNPMEEQKIAETLVQGGIITIEQLKKAVEFRDSIGGGAIRDLVIKLGYATEEAVSKALGSAPLAQIRALDIDLKAMEQAEKVIEKHKVVILKGKSLGLVRLAMADVNNLAAIEEIQFLTDSQVEPIAAQPPAIEAALGTWKVLRSQPAVEDEDDDDEVEDAPAVEDEPDDAARALGDLPTDLMLRSFIMAMVERGHVSLDDILRCADRIEKG